MSSNSIPTYSLTFFNLYDHIEIKEASDLLISMKALKPKDASIPSIILRYLEAFSKDYVHHLRKEFNKDVTIKTFFSLENGLQYESNDEKVKEVFNIIFQEQMENSAVLAEHEAIESKLTHLKRNNFVTEEIKQKAIEGLKAKNVLADGEEVIYLDRVAFSLWKEGIREPIAVNLEICAQEAMGKGFGLTTGSMRYPHLLLDLSERFKDKTKRDQTQICIVGPGLLEEEHAPLMCPQFTELLSIFPHANFLLLDNNKKALEAMQKQFCEKNFITFDPFMMRVYTFNDSTKNPFFAPQKYQLCFQNMKENLEEKAISKAMAKGILNNTSKINYILLKTNPKKIKVREFDINTAEFAPEEKGLFDVIVATMSLSIVLQEELIKNPHYNSFNQIAKFLEALKVNGSLYLDSGIFEIFKKNYTPEGLVLGIQYLESILGNRLTMHEIPLSDFMNVEGPFGVIPSCSLRFAEKHDLGQTLTTCSLTVITRSTEKVQMSKKKKQEIKRQFEVMNS